MWFEKLTGFKEINPEQVRELIKLDGLFLTSKVNDKTYRHGRLEIPTLAELRQFDLQKIDKPSLADRQIELREIVADVGELHKDSNNKNAVFQAASQFNLLEMVNPSVSPEDGIDIYENDFTQGPACAIACGAGTIYRNYFVSLDNQIGQTDQCQVDCLDQIALFFDNDKHNFWRTSNGYALLSESGLSTIDGKLKNMSSEEYETLKGKLKVGIQWETQVTTSADSDQIVHQVYCSALPIAYSNLNVAPSTWEALARLILEATYESTFYAAAMNYQKTGVDKLYLTLVGGGVFGNPMSWILESVEKSLERFKHIPLDVNIVSYGQSDSDVRYFIDRWND